MLENTPLQKVVATVAFAAVCCALNPTARADDQAERIQALEKRLENSVELIQKLAARVAELERAAAGNTTRPLPAAVAASAPAEQARAIATLQHSVDQISEGLSKRGSDTGLPLHGFADVQAGWSEASDPMRLRGFSAGNLDIYLTPQFGDRVKTLIELVVEYDPDGSQAVDMERSQVGYTVSDALTVWMGRFHTPFGLWNTSFHHGANLQTSISRPRFVDFEDKGGLIPAHSVGLWASGKRAFGDGKLTYDGYLSNGPSVRNRSIDFNAFTDDDSGKMVGLNIGYQPTHQLSGLTVGVHGFGSTVRAYAASGALLSRTRLRMGGAYFGYDESDWEAIGEYYHFANADADSGARRSSNAGFVQVGKTFGSVTPFVRYEQASLNLNDNYFLTQRTGRSFKRAVVGARYAWDARSSFKFELTQTSEPAVIQIDENGALAPFSGASYRRATFQYSIAF